MKKSIRKAFFYFALVITTVLITATGFAAFAKQVYNIESISVEKVTLVKDYSGQYAIEEGKQEYFRYSTENPSKVTVTLENGKTITDSLSALEDYFNESAEISDSQSAENPWKTGAYTVQFTFMGYSGEYAVEVVDNPVEKITVENIELCYLGDGDYSYDSMGQKGNFYYRSEPKEMTVYFKDGTSKSGTAQSFGKLTGYNVSVFDNQNEKPWGIGRHKCSVEYLGVKADYYVTVKESPVRSISVDEVTVYEGIDGHWGDYYGDDAHDSNTFYYDAKPEKVTVYYKDGTAFTGSTEEIKQETGYTVVFDTDKAWSYGRQVAKATYLGASVNYYVQVKVNPIKAVALIKAPDKLDYRCGEFFDAMGSVVRVAYIDGRIDDVDIFQDYTGGTIIGKLEKIGKTFDTGRLFTVEDTTVSFDFFGKNIDVNINLATNSFTGVTLSKDKDGFPSLSFTASDGSQVDAKILNICTESISSLSPGEESYGLFITDIGTYEATITRRIEGDSVCISADGYLESNFCEGINWSQADMTFRASIIYKSYNNVDAYNGLVASDNIDTLITFAAIGSGAGKPSEIHEDYMIYTATEIQKSVKDFFDIDGIEVTLSKNYDPYKNSVKIIIPSTYRTINVHPVMPFSCEYKDGYFKATYTFSDGEKMDVAADSKGRIASYKVANAMIHKHTMITIPGTAPTYIKSGLTDGVRCSSCGAVLTAQTEIPKLILGKTDKLVSAQSTNAIKIAWFPVKGATGYEVFYRLNSTAAWRSCLTTAATSATFKNLPSGQKYSFAVKAYVIENGKVLKSSEFTSIETSTKALKPVKVISAQNSNAIKLVWTKSAGATGYGVFNMTSAGWRIIGATVKNSAFLANLEEGTRYIYAIKPYVITSSGIIWSDDYALYVAATLPAAPTVTAKSPSETKVNLTYSAVNGAEVYQVFFKIGDGNYRLYRNYTKAGTLYFANLPSGTTYTFAVRAAKKTTNGWIFGPLNTSIVTVK